MSMIKIRKNAFLKIQTILAGSVGVICRSSSSRIDEATMMSIVCPRAMRL